MNLDGVFQNLGLSQEYASIYLTLMKDGKLRIIDIAKNTGLPRTSCYDYIPRLISLGLIKEKQINKSRYYYVSNPDNLLQLLYKEKNDLNYNLNNLENNFNDLVSLYEQREVSSTIVNSKDQDEIDSFLDNTSTQKASRIILWCGNNHSAINTKKQKIFKKYVLNSKSIVDEGIFKALKLSNTKNLVLSKFSDEPTFELIQSNFVLYLHEGFTSALIIKDLNYVKNEVLKFNLLFDSLKS